MNDAWFDAVRNLDLPEAGRVLKSSPDGAVWRIDAGGSIGLIVLKCERVTAASQRFKIATRTSRLHRHWRGATWLEQHSIPTPTCLALFVGCHGADTVQTLVMTCLDGRTLLEHLRDDDDNVRTQHDIARDAADLCMTLLKAGRFNRDHKPSNLLRTLDGRIHVLDCVAIRPCPVNADDARVRMLASLFIEPHGIGVAPRMTLCMRVIARATETRTERHQLWRDVAERVRNHGSSTPEHSPFPDR